MQRSGMWGNRIKKCRVAEATIDNKIERVKRYRKYTKAIVHSKYVGHLQKVL
jgi:hypothetical protein